jgi:hypothetical protein
MSGRQYHRHSDIGFGGAVGLGLAVALLVTVIAIGHALAAQLEGAMRAVIVFATVAVCTVLAAATLAVVGLLAYRVQLARHHLAERSLAVKQQARQLYTVRAEVLKDDHAEALEGDAAEALEGERPTRPVASDQGGHRWDSPRARLWAVPRDDEGGAS